MYTAESAMRCIKLSFIQRLRGLAVMFATTPICLQSCLPSAIFIKHCKHTLLPQGGFHVTPNDIPKDSIKISYPPATAVSF